MFDADGDGRAEDVFYNGYRAGRDIIGPAYYDAQGNMTPCDEPQGARHLGVQNMAEACMQGRGVMIDLEAHFGRTGHIVSHAELMEVMRKDSVTVEPGDFVLFRTGFAEMLLEMNKQPDREKLMAGTVGLDGRDPKLQQWVTDSGAVALISDNFAVESMPALHGRRLRHAAAARALPVQAGLLSRRDVLPDRTRRLAACQQPQPLPVHRPAAAPAWRGGLAGHAGGDGLTAHGRRPQERYVSAPPDRSLVFWFRLSISAWAPPRDTSRRKSERCTATRLIEPSASTSTALQPLPCRRMT